MIMTTAGELLTPKTLTLVGRECVGCGCRWCGLLVVPSGHQQVPPPSSEGRRAVAALGS